MLTAVVNRIVSTGARAAIATRGFPRGGLPW